MRGVPSFSYLVPSGRGGKRKAAYGEMRSAATKARVKLCRLEDISLSRRFGLAIAVVLGLALGVAATDYFAEAQILEPKLYEDIPLDSTLLHLDKQALEDAYHQYLLLLFSTWLKGDVAEDQRIKAGLK